ncbi:hypothetical protein Sinac_0287 [Singulisphaera acidiphila DSM 18658]|uniref:Transposase n=1 Tax=Singulisphaera acidiphila (strain ATCC BAA-1392 / DSM 18658 / VKM B-2454 / MOB10) TaxID=886293 RepID=L0D7V4_SINAD|nr:hypothetical protein Sinac_0287 [Singulisphaera acidiphila DSM 18658]
MAGKRKIHTAAFKALVALAVLKGDRTINSLAGQYGVYPMLIHGWKKQLVTGAEEVFGSPPGRALTQGVQHGSGGAVHIGSVHRATGGGQCGGRHGRPREGVG